MSTHQAAIIGCIVSFILSIIGAMFAEKRIIQKAKEILSTDDSIFNITFIGFAFIEFLPVMMLIFTIIIIID